MRPDLFHHHGLRCLAGVFFWMVHIFDGRAGGVPCARAGGAAKDGVAERFGFAVEGEGGDVAVVAVFPVLVADFAIVVFAAAVVVVFCFRAVVAVIAQCAQGDACGQAVGIDEVATAGVTVELGRGEGRGDADVGVVRQFRRVKHGAAVRGFVAQFDVPAVAARFVHRRGVEVLRVQPQRLFAGVGDAHRAVVVAFFEFGEGDGFAVDGNGGVGGEFGRDGGEAYQPGELLRAEVAVMRQRPRQRFAFFRVLFGDGVGGVVRVVLYALPQGLQLGKADEVVRGEADAAAVGVAVAVLFLGYSPQALVCRRVFAE